MLPGRKNRYGSKFTIINQDMHMKGQNDNIVGAEEKFKDIRHQQAMQEFLSDKLDDMD